MKSVLNRDFMVRILSAAIVVIAMLGLSGCGKTYSRDEFAKLVQHKTEAEVRSIVGEPAWIGEGKPLMWTYHSKTFDAASQNKADSKVVLELEPDASGTLRVTNIRYE